MRLRERATGSIVGICLSVLIGWISAPALAQGDGEDWDKGLSPQEWGETYARDYLSQPSVAAGFYRALSGLGTALPPGRSDIAETSFWDSVIASGLHQEYGLPAEAERWEVIRELSGYICRDTYANRDLHRLLETRPLSDAYVQAWMADRLKLFAFCGDSIPMPDGDGDGDGWAVQTIEDPPFRVFADVAYFNAVVQFYAENFEEALAQFERIAADPGNAHQDAARTMLVELWSGLNWHVPFQDHAKARAVLDDWRAQHVRDDFSQWAYESAIGMLTYATRSEVDARRDVETTLALLSRSNEALRQDPILRRRFDRVLMDLDEFLCLGYRTQECPDGPRSDALLDHVETDPIARFLDVSFNRHQALRPKTDLYHFSGQVLRLPLPADIDIPTALAPLQRDSLPWLVLAMEFAVPGNDALSEIQDRSAALAARIADGSASIPEQIAWPSLFRSRLRHYLDAGEHAAALSYFDTWKSRFSLDYLRNLQCDWAARAILEGAPDQARDVLATLPLDLAHRDYFISCSTSLAFYLAEDLDQAWTALQGSMPDRSKAAYLNLLPSADTLRRLEQDALLPPFQESTLRALLGRALVLRDEALWRGSMRLLADLNPEAAAELAESAGSATDLPPPDRADLTLLRFPRLRLRVFHPVDPWFLDEDLDMLGEWRAIDIFQHTANNYWCAFDPDSSIQTMIDDLAFDLLSARYRANPEEQARSARAAAAVIEDHPILDAMDEIEVARLVAVEAAPIYLPRIALQLSNRHRAGRVAGDVSEEEIAEALHLAIRATRYACPAAEGRARGSRAAWRRLDADHRNSDWMARTPFWFDDPY